MSGSSDVQTYAKRLYDAAHEHRAINRLTQERPLDEREAYAIQWALVQEHVAHGGKVAGKKTGLTSKAKQVQMHTSEPLYAYLIDLSLIHI